ncbi:mitochondrial import receptor subunit TOM40 homolog [Danaus plexippus]|uniref:Mitochondrial import receptor subunit TOM40 protein n=1 Tax=Danaus plexippus plexippus TaxID=278856 RepID=A0A212FJ57_DANPL|nr:mitochondrial import receptor subunit TOM40 homolog [Danaus plexippus]OWR53762.1 Mitochondrial import receptor subunit TOM40 protein [Danaus plexippus plexippus]
MEINESVIKEEVGNFLNSLQKLLPKKKDFIVIRNDKPTLTRLSDVHAEAKKVFPQCFVGAKMVIMRDVLEKVKLVQNYNLGKSKDSYKCFSQLIHKEMDEKNVADGLLVDSAGSATATYTEKMNDYEMKLTSKIKDLVSSETEISFETDSKKSIRSMSFALKDADPNTLKVVTQWMYKVSPEFCVGSEMGFKLLSYPLSPELSISARYDKPAFTLSSTISRAGYQVCLFKPFTSDLRIATIINENNRGGSATIGLALHKSYENSELKIFVDSQRCGGFTFEKDVLFKEQQNDVRVIRLMVSTIIDRQKRVRCGFGFNLDF